MHKTIIAIVVTCSTFGLALAQTKKAPPTIQKPTQYVWDKEPATVFGIKLGDTITEGAVPTCNLPSSANGYKLPDELCLEQTSTSVGLNRYQELWGVPLPQISTATVVFQENMVESIIINMPHHVFNQMHVMLVERYGLPTKTDNEMVKTRNGGEFSSKNLTWSGVANSVYLYERSGTIDKSLAVFSNNALSDAKDTKNKNFLKNAASKF